MNLGVARGCGWQKIGAFVNLGAFYAVSIPSAILLAFVFHFNGKVISIFLVNYKYYACENCVILPWLSGTLDGNYMWHICPGGIAFDHHIMY